MDEELLRSIESKKYLYDQVTSLSQVQQLALGATVATSTPNMSTLATTAATNLYATATTGVLSAQPYYKKEVDDAALFMDDNLKILATSPYAKSLNNMHKIDDMSAISSRYAITEYFNIIYYDNLLAPGSKCKYSINDTKNIVKHNNIFGQTFENIVQHKSSFPIGKTTWKWENLHKALI